jgi:hypothetical protein
MKTKLTAYVVVVGGGSSSSKETPQILWNRKDP